MTTITTKVDLTEVGKAKNFKIRYYAKINFNGKELRGYVEEV